MVQDIIFHSTLQRFGTETELNDANEFLLSTAAFLGLSATSIKGSRVAGLSSNDNVNRDRPISSLSEPNI